MPITFRRVLRYQDDMTLENILRGSGDIGAMLATAQGVCQVDAEKNHLYIQNVKPRDFQPCQPFVIEGRPHLDMVGQFDMLQPPGNVGKMRQYLNRGSNRGGRPEIPDKQEKIDRALVLQAERENPSYTSRIHWECRWDSSEVVFRNQCSPEHLRSWR